MFHIILANRRVDAKETGIFFVGSVTITISQGSRKCKFYFRRDTGSNKAGRSNTSTGLWSEEVGRIIL